MTRKAEYYVPQLKALQAVPEKKNDVLNTLERKKTRENASVHLNVLKRVHKFLLKRYFFLIVLFHFIYKKLTFKLVSLLQVFKLVLNQL